MISFVHLQCVILVVVYGKTFSISNTFIERYTRSKIIKISIIMYINIV